MAAQNVENGFTTGSLAFENAARQVTGAISLPDEDAKKFGLEDNRKDYIKLEMPKNSYGKAGEHCYLRKNIVPDFYTATRVVSSRLTVLSLQTCLKRARLLRQWLGR
jgi:hypothetical protein